MTAMAISSRKIWGSLTAKPNQLNLMRGFCTRPLPTNALVPELRASTSKVTASRFSNTIHSTEGISMIKSEMWKMKIDQRKYYSVLRTTETKAQRHAVETENNAAVEKNSLITAKLERMKENLRKYESDAQEMDMMKEFNCEMETIVDHDSECTQSSGGYEEVMKLISEQRMEFLEDEVKNMKENFKEQDSKMQKMNNEIIQLRSKDEIIQLRSKDDFGAFLDMCGFICILYIVVILLIALGMWIYHLFHNLYEKAIHFFY